MEEMPSLVPGRPSANRRGAINHTLNGGSAVRWRAGKLRRRWPIQLRAIVTRGTLLWALQPIAQTPSKYVFTSHLTRAEDEPLRGVPILFAAYAPFHPHILHSTLFCTSLLIPACILCSRLTSRSRRGTDAPALSPPGKHTRWRHATACQLARQRATRRARPATPRGAQQRATVLLAALYQAWSPLCGVAKSRTQQQRGGYPIFRAAAASLCWTGCHSSAAVRDIQVVGSRLCAGRLLLPFSSLAL